MSEKAYVVKAPGLVVRSNAGTGYCASMVHTCSQNGRWGLAFLSSGGLNFLPWDEVKGVEYYPAAPNGRQHCDVCDARLTAYPVGEAETGVVVEYAYGANGHLVCVTCGGFGSGFEDAPCVCGKTR